MQTVPSINEDRLFNLLPHFFERPSEVLIELCQNAKRAGATRIEIRLGETDLRVTDNGHGLSDPTSLFVLSESDWSDAVEKEQMPAGWGLFFLYSLAKRVLFRSHFGTVQLEPERFLAEKEYRETILSRVRPKEKGSGFTIEAEVAPDIAEELSTNAHELLAYFDLEVVFNGKVILRKSLKHKSNGFFKTSYQGNTVWLQAHRYFPESADKLPERTDVVWYGIPIFRQSYMGTYIMIDVKTGGPVTPVLPFRSSIKVDDKLREFYQFCRREVVNHCLAVIENRKIDEKSLKNAMETLETVGDQADLDGLSRFYVTISEPHASSSHCGVSDKTEFVPKGERPVSETLKLMVDGEEASDEEYVLPAGVIRTIELPKKRPGWLTIDDREVVIQVTPRKREAEDTNHNWRKAWIRCEKKVSVLCQVSDWREFTIFYAEDPAHIDQISEVVFDAYRYDDDGDRYDTQLCGFQDEVEEDLMKLASSFDRALLLKGLQSAGISPDKVTRITVTKKKMRVKAGKKTHVLAIR